MAKSALLTAAFLGIAMLISNPVAARAGIDSKPCVVHLESLNYPRIARAAHIDGTVVLRIHIGSDGHVLSAEKVRGPDLLANAAETNALSWVFAPSGVGTLELQYEFRLGPPAKTYDVESQVKFDLPTRVIVTVPAIPIEP